MRLLSLRAAVLASLLPLSGCLVTQSTYDALAKDLADTKTSMQGQLDQKTKDAAQKDQENSDLKTQLKKEQQKSAELGERIKKGEGDLEALQKQKSQLEADHSAMLKDKKGLQDSVEEMKKALAELARRKAEADARIAEFRNLLERFKGLIDAGKLRVKIVEGRMVVELASDILFSSGSANLSKEGKAAIAEVAGLLASIPDRKFQVEGHTDNVPIATAQYPSNWELASSRAITVLRTMVDAGMPVERISASSYGDSKPAKPNDTPEGKAANRRIEIVVVPDLSSLPGFEELKKASAR